MVRVCLFIVSALVTGSQAYPSAPHAESLHKRKTWNVTIGAIPGLVGPPCVDPYQSLIYAAFPDYMDSACAAPCSQDSDCSDGEDCQEFGKHCEKRCESDSDCDFKSSDSSQTMCIGTFCSWLSMNKCKSRNYTIQASADLCNAKCESLQCSNQYCMDMSGEWIQVSESSGKQTLTFEHGVTKSYTVSDSFTWGTSVTNSVNSGFKFGPFSSGVTVTGEVSASMSNSYSSTFAETDMTAFQYQFDKAGVVWQWQWKSMEPCGSSITKGQDVVMTEGAWAPPCCLPGWFNDITNPHGECHPAPDGSVYTLCSSLPTTATTTAPATTTEALDETTGLQFV